MSSYENWIIEPDRVKEFSGNMANEKIVFTNGCYDLIHRGHVKLLNTARSFGDYLVVGINSDDSVARLKGPGRPLCSAEDRAFVLLNLRAVDYVTVFDEDTPQELIRKLRPDILVKGDEYALEEIVGADFQLSRGAAVERVPMVEGYSTSSIIEKIREMEKG
ncbi:MAG: D-glycero-beta-D-manno-heptose 1-phosphate adenylyltransferase [Candidatus Latescibacteria bacterium]|nr:D-glycero-beta-D-manno-heptose 1-phosphate adenylyltransferase [bacterium]MBD3424080.1 D-glycero-beta-D-manno-heptose 1-phosphate adenylyltransferase [Candidatus Latescibacterota bacterium]